MLDSLDLEALRQEGKAYRRTWWRTNAPAKHAERFANNFRTHFPELDIVVPTYMYGMGAQTLSFLLGIVALGIFPHIAVALSISVCPFWIITLFLFWFTFGRFIHKMIKSNSTNPKPEASGGRRYGLLFLVLIILLFVIFEVLDSIGIPSIYALLLVLFLILTRSYLPLIWSIHGTVTRGNYEAGLERLRALQWLIPKSISNFSVYVNILITAGHYDEASTYSKDMLISTPAHSINTKATTILWISEAMLEKGEYETLLPIIESLIESLPFQHESYRLLAKYYCYQNIHSKRMLQITEVMMDFVRKPRIRIWRVFMGWEHSISLHAVALARNGQIEEARRIIAEVIPRTKTIKPNNALMNYRGGLVELAAEDKDAARAYFQRALELDPNGAAGQKAQAALAEL